MQYAENHSVDMLNNLLRGELSAVETYAQALEKVEDPEIRNDLLEARRSHADRVDIIKQRVLQIGGYPATTSGVWGVLAKTMEGGATLFGDIAAVDMLEEGEDRGLEEYRKLLEEIEPSVRAIAVELLPRQEDTHNLISALKHRLH